MRLNVKHCVESTCFPTTMTCFSAATSPPQRIQAPISQGTRPGKGPTWMVKPHLVSLSSNKTKLAGPIHYLRGPTRRLSNTLLELIKCLFKAEVNVNTKLKANWLTRSGLWLIIRVRNELLALGWRINFLFTSSCSGNLPYIWSDLNSSVCCALDTALDAENVFWLGRIMFWI